MKKFARFFSVACSVIMLASCAKGCSFEDAKAQAGKYSMDNVQETAGTAKTVTNVKKAEGVYSTLYKVGQDEKTTNVTPAAAMWNTATVTAIGSSVNWKIDGTALSYEGSITKDQFIAQMKDSGVTIESNSVKEFKSSAKGACDANGLSKSSYEYVYMDFSATALGVTVSGKLEMEVTVTYSFTK